MAPSKPASFLPITNENPSTSDRSTTSLRQNIHHIHHLNFSSVSSFISLILDKPHTLNEHPCLNQALRHALISVSHDTSPSTRSCLSGHTPEGDILQQPHLMILPLIRYNAPNRPLFSHGLQLVIPEQTPEIIRLEIELTIRRLDTLYLNNQKSYRIKRVQTHKVMIRPNNVLLNSSHLWTTLTPLMLDRFPKEKNPLARQHEIAQIIAASCRHFNLPEPLECIITFHSLINGIPPFHGFPKPTLQHGNKRPLLHATLIFKQNVSGPIVLGAARYKGFGIFSPLDIKISSFSTQALKTTRKTQHKVH